MPIDWHKRGLNLAKRTRDLALTALALGGAQIVLALLLWLAILRSQPLGFSMALSLVGFGGWFVALASSLGAQRSMRDQGRARRPSAPQPNQADTPTAMPPWMALGRERIERSGCGLVLFLSGLIPLGLAFYLRLQADMRLGKTWSDIFPTLP
jgi:hypothetical protein